MHRRQLLVTGAVAAAGSAAAAALKADEIDNGTPWGADSGSPPSPYRTGGWAFFSDREAAMVGAIADRLIPADALSIGGREAGCAEFIDRQLAGDYGRGATLYLKGPFRPGTPQQGPQGRAAPAEQYREGLAALASWCAAQPGGKAFVDLSPERQDEVLQSLEAGDLRLEGVDGAAFFNLLLKNVREGFFADPIYGGNKDMAGWKMLGFPGARYDYRDVIGRRGEALDLEPVSLISRTP